MTMKKEENKLTPAEERSLNVVKSNDLIMKSRFNFTVQEQKIINYIVSKLTPTDTQFQLYEFDIQDFCKVCGLVDEGKQYRQMKKAVQSIRDKSMWVTLPSGEETTVSFIEKPYISKRSGIIKIKIDEDMRPYLLNLRQNYTQFELLWTLRFKSHYSIRLYEIVKSLHFNELKPYEWTFSLEDLRKKLGVEEHQYQRWCDFKNRVLDPAVKEINAYSDKHLTYDNVMRGGRNVTGIVLHIDRVDSIERMLKEDENNAVLDGQVSLFEDGVK